jgi:pimeloyl-ACP methyl ester carboxylesterase
MTSTASSNGHGNRAVVPVRGGRLNKESRGKQARVLLSAGLRVLAIDLRGYGRTQAGTSFPSLAAPMRASMRAPMGLGSPEFSSITPCSRNEEAGGFRRLGLCAVDLRYDQGTRLTEEMLSFHSEP